MHSGSGLRIKRIDDELIVQSEPTSAFTKRIGALIAGFALCWTIALTRLDGRSEVAYWLVLTFGMIMIVVSISLVLPWSVTVVVDSLKTLDPKRPIREGDIVRLVEMKEAAK